MASRNSNTLNVCCLVPLQPVRIADPGLAVLGDADDRDDAGADRLLAVVGEALEVLRLQCRRPRGRGTWSSRRRGRRCRRRCRRRPWRASCAPRRDRARAGAAPRPASATRSAASSGRTFSADATALSRFSCSARCFRAAAPVSASMRRTPAATALSPTTRDQADLAGAADMGAAAELDRIGPAGHALGHGAHA